MPVLITGATGLVGRALAARLVDEGGQVRAYVRRDDPDLRALGVHVAVGAGDDVERLESALTCVHTIVHLIGGVWPERDVTYDWLNRDTTESAVIAARAAGVRRFVFLSFLGADPGSDNEFLAAKGKAERHITSSGLQHAIFRCAPIAEGLAALLGRLSHGPIVNVPGDGRQRVAPVALADVVEAIVAADAREAEVAGTWAIAGSEVMTMDEAAARYTPAARAMHVRFLSGAPRALVDAYARDLVPDGDAAPFVSPERRA